MHQKSTLSLFHTPRPAAALIAAVLMAASAPAAHAGDPPYIGEMMLFGSSFCPAPYYLKADGATVSIAKYETLFTLLGTTYGGDGVNTFALPNLSGRVPVGTGQSQGTSTVILGQTGGTESALLTTNNLPAHAHTLSATTEPATHAAPATGRLPAQAQNAGVYRNAGGTTVEIVATGPAGSSQPFSVRNPYLGMTWCISVNGIFPSRS